MFPNVKWYVFEREREWKEGTNEGKCGEREIISKGMIISKVLNVMEQQEGQKN